MKKSKKIEEQTEIIIQQNQTPQQSAPAKPGCTIPLNGCLWFLCLLFLTGIVGNEYKRSKVRLEEMKKDGVVVDYKTPVVMPDTLKIGNYQKTYIPLMKLYQDQERGK